MSVSSYKRNYYTDKDHKHNCGPLNEGDTLQTNLQAFFDSRESIFFQILEFIINSWVTLIILLVATIILMQFLRTEHRMLRDKFLQDIDEFQGRIQIMKKQVRRQENKIEMLQKATKI